MSLKTKAALTYLLPLLLIYVGAVTVMSVGTRPEWAELFAGAIPSTGLLLVSHLLQDLVPKPAKEAFVFFRTKHRMPSHRAYTEVGRGDGRVTNEFLLAVAATSDMSPRAQSARWFAKYNKVRDLPQVKHANMRYLAWRDGAAASLVLALATPVLGAIFVLRWSQVAYLSAGCVLAALVIAQAARNMAGDLVREVVALEAAGAIS